MSPSLLTLASGLFSPRWSYFMRQFWQRPWSRTTLSTLLSALQWWKEDDGRGKASCDPVALFTVNFTHLHYNVLERRCGAISGNFAAFSRNSLTSTFQYIVMQMRNINCEKSYCRKGSFLPLLWSHLALCVQSLHNGSPI